MYAQLCKRLQNEVPNFEQDDCKTCTFILHLLNRCRKEFENRSQNVQEAAFIESNSSNDEDAEEKRLVAKGKMLGNVKFICELAKLHIVNEAILHKCIQTLLHFPATNMPQTHIPTEDLECLCQIMRNCGRLLDTSESHRLMEQYFESVRLLCQKRTYSLRIQFLLKDVCELRANRWHPRQVSVVEGPMPVSQVALQMNDDDGGWQQFRRDYYRSHNQNNIIGSGGFQIHHQHQYYDGVRGGAGGYRSGGSGGGDYDRHNNHYASKLFGHPLRTRGGLDDMFNMNAAAHHHSMTLYGAGVGGQLPQMSSQQQQQQPRDGSFRGHNNQRGQYRHNQNANSQYNNNNNQVTKDLAPRFKKSLIMSKEDINYVELRPISMLFNKESIKVNTPSPPISLVSTNHTNNMNNNSKNVVSPITTSNNGIANDAMMPSSEQSSLPIMDKPKQSKKDKGPTKEEVLNNITVLLSDYWKNEQDLKQTCDLYMDMKIPEKFINDAVLHGFKIALDKAEVEQEKLVRFFSNLKEIGTISGQTFIDQLKPFINELNQHDREIAKAMKSMAYLLAVAISEKLVRLTDVAVHTENGSHYPLFLIVLQQFGDKYGRNTLSDLFSSTSKINLMSQLPDNNDKNKVRLSEILDEYDLTFLYPLLRIQSELARQLSTDANPATFHAWLKTQNYDTNDAIFINALITVLITYITQEVANNCSTTVISGNSSNNNGGGGETPIDNKIIVEKEKAMLSRYLSVVQSFLSGKPQLQLTAIYSVQVHFYSLDSPRGQLLRWFMALQDLGIIDDETFFNWRDDLTDAYPGKKKALFETNQWFTWLAVSDDEDDDDD